MRFSKTQVELKPAKTTPLFLQIKNKVFMLLYVCPLKKIVYV